MSILEWDFGICADSGHDEDGHPEIGLDHYGPVGEASGAKAVTMHPFGFDSRAMDPDMTGGEVTAGCGALVAHDGDRMNIMPLDDPRVVAKLPKLRKGGSRQYCAAGNFAMFDGEDPAKKERAGGYTIGIKYGTKSHLLSMAIRKDGKEEVSLKHGEGMGVVATAGGKRSILMRNAGGDAYFETNDKGNVINGATKVQGAMSIGSPASATSVALAEPLIAVLGQLITIVAAINVSTPGAPAGALSAELAAIKAKMLSAT